MAPPPKQPSLLLGFARFSMLVYHSIVRDVRVRSGSAALGILSEVGQILLFFVIFYLMYTILGRSVAIRGDFFLYLLSGIFLLVIHMGALNAVRKAGSSVSPMMMHSPMSVILAIISGALATLFLQTIAIMIILFFVFIFRDGITIYNPKGIVAPLFFAWASGVSLGMVFRIAGTVAPGPFGIFSKFYLRAQMISSGKFMPAAYLPASMVAWFSWNPLFHTIDQMRLAVFINYTREITSMAYPIYFTMVCLVIGLMGDLWLRQFVTKSKHG
ncbi:MAG: ABC transporter permease [Rhodobacteraceae bacterium]|nr:ABC transporter permease [Paracoccaceae bacterium]